MNKYLIALNGCDDTTYCELELNDKELEFLIKISKEINKYSTYQCEPTISIYKDYENLDGKRDFIIWKAIDLVEKVKENK